MKGSGKWREANSRRPLQTAFHPGERARDRHYAERTPPPPQGHVSLPPDTPFLSLGRVCQRTDCQGEGGIPRGTFRFGAGLRNETARGSPGPSRRLDSGRLGSGGVCLSTSGAESTGRACRAHSALPSRRFPLPRPSLICPVHYVLAHALRGFPSPATVRNRARCTLPRTGLGVLAAQCLGRGAMPTAPTQPFVHPEPVLISLAQRVQSNLPTFWRFCALLSRRCLLQLPIVNDPRYPVWLPCSAQSSRGLAFSPLDICRLTENTETRGCERQCTGCIS